MAGFDRRARHVASRPTILIAAFAAVLAMAALSYLAAVAPRGVPGVGYLTVKAEFADSADLRLLSSVAVSGRRVGQVVKITSRDGIAELELQLDPDTVIRSDSTARIRLKNPVGAKYVAITPGATGRALENGEILPARQTSAAVDTPELLSGFPAATRADLQDTVSGLGRGFLGRGQDLNGAIPKAPPLLRDAASVSNAILARRGAAERLFPSLEKLAEAYEPVREQVAAGFRPQARALEAFADRRESVQDLLDVAPPALSALRAGLDRTRPLLDETAALARATSRLTVPAPAALRETTALLREGAPALERTRPLLDAVGDAVPPTLKLLDTVNPVIAPSRKFLANQIRPLREFGTRGCDVLSWAANWRSALAFGVPAGADPLSDLDTSLEGLGPNQNSFRVLAVPPTDSQALSPDSPNPDLAVGRNAYPAACTARGERFP